MLAEFAHHFTRLQTLAIGPQRFNQAGGDVEQRDILFYQGRNARAQDFQRHLGAGVGALAQHGKMHLCHRGAGYRLGLEVGENVLNGTAEGALDDGARLDRRKGRHLVLQLGQFFGDILGQQVATRGQHLAELYENRPQRLEGLAQPHRARLGKAPPRQYRLDEHREAPGRRGGEQKLLETETQGDGNDA